MYSTDLSAESARTLWCSAKVLVCRTNVLPTCSVFSPGYLRDRGPLSLQCRFAFEVGLGWSQNLRCGHSNIICLYNNQFRLGEHLLQVTWIPGQVIPGLSGFTSPWSWALIDHILCIQAYLCTCMQEHDLTSTYTFTKWRLTPQMLSRIIRLYRFKKVF